MPTTGTLGFDFRRAAKLAQNHNHDILVETAVIEVIDQGGNALVEHAHE